ncbi:putative retrotransposon ty1-copia subclass protein, partial [Tanacetum coccineum]
MMRLNMRVSNHLEHELGDFNEPPNYKAALSDPESDKWVDAMNADMQSMKDNQVWLLVNLPPNGRTIGSKWLFKKKTDINSNVHTFKAFIMENGYTQTYGVDYRENFSPITDIRVMRIVLAIVAFYDYEICQMYVKTALLIGHLSEDVVWHCEALMKRDTPEKLESMSINCIFIGYPKEMIEASGSNVDLEVIQDVNTQPFENTSQHHDEVEHESVKPSSDIDPIRRSVDAMNAEMQSMKNNQVWRLVDLPPNGRTIGSKWLFKKKTDIDSNVHTFKAFLMANGYTQTYGVD